jgi:signal transduction histidine kinase
VGVSSVTRMGDGRQLELGRARATDRADEIHMSGISEAAPGAAPADGDGRRRLKIGAKWRIAAASAAIGLLMCGAFAFTAYRHGESVRANAQAHLDREDVLAAERAVSAFWQEREVMGEMLSFPDRNLAGELRSRRLRFGQALRGIVAESSVGRAHVELAKTANENLIAVFDDQPVLSGSVESDRQAARLHAAERSVLRPIEQLRVSNRRDNLRAEASADSAERAAFRSEIATAGFGLAAVALFGFFAMRQVRRIDDQNAELQSADLAKDEFIATVSHELRTPLTSMNGYVELLLEEGADPLTQEQRSFLATVQRGSVRLQRLMNDLLLTAQVRSGHLDIQKTRSDVVELARQAVEGAQAHAGHKALQLSLAAPSDSIVIDADVVRMAQAIDNLISNAIKFTPESGRVDVTLAQNGERMTLTVADTGMGMTAADIDHLFERFFRTDSAQVQQIQGSGLGLPIVKAIVEAHDGTIAVTSEPNVGTSFVISLPLARPLEDRDSPGLLEPLVAV